MILILLCYELILKKCIEDTKVYWCMALIVIAIQSAMEHHFIQYWYNPFLVALFSKVTLNECKVEKNENNRVLDLN